jgi:peptidylprolyl isomerase
MAQAASDGNKVRIHYTGRLDDGTVFDSSKGRDPLDFTLGEGRVIPGFEKAVRGMAVGDEKTAVIPAEEAYGAPRDELYLRVPLEQMPDGYEPEVGGQLQMTTADGQPVPVRVKEVEEDAVVLDANHPLAGQQLTFEIELVEVADA